MKLRIISDGDPRHTHIVNVETGEDLEGVQGISWHISNRDIATVNLKMVNVPVDVIGYDITEMGMKYRKYSTLETDTVLWNFIL